ncbi:WD40 repeat domain-containing protein [Streptomyces sp. NPDC000070]|uniref:WD40 repeat domain-containing protein n=1 Tax=Streptomyces sp. NPDC000070 TaxID=3154240 RepID=UPI0033172895
MNVDELVCEALRDQAAGQPPAAPGFADRVLAVRRRRLSRRLASAAAAAAAVVAVAVAVPMLDTGKQDVRPSGGVEQTSVTARPEQSPPRDVIAAGRVALAAYYTSRNVERSADRAVSQRTYWLLNPETKKYEKADRWSYVAAAPGLETAAVLERDLPVWRIGLLDLASGEVKRWIPIDRPVAGVEFSADGTKLVATTYDQNPDQRVKIERSDGWASLFMKSYRTGFHVIDVASGRSSWAGGKVSSGPDDPGGFINSRQDFGFSRDGSLVWAGLPSEPGKRYYDVSGKEVAPPARERYRDWPVKAGVSPDGALVAGQFAGKKWKTSSLVLDSRTGKTRTEVRGQQLLAWVDGDSLVARDIGPDGNEYHQRLVLVTMGSDKVVPLSGYRSPKDDTKGRWEPVFAER